MIKRMTFTADIKFKYLNKCFSLTPDTFFESKILNECYKLLTHPTSMIRR